MYVHTKKKKKKKVNKKDEYQVSAVVPRQFDLKFHRRGSPSAFGSNEVIVPSITL